MARIARKLLAGTVTVALVAGAAGAQAPAPRTALPPAFVAPAVAASPISDTDREILREGLAAARARDLVRAEASRAALSHPVARKVVQWAILDAAPEQAAFFELDQGRRDLWGWPRAATRQRAAERKLESGGLSARRTVDWFGGEAPQTLEGAMALAGALQATGKVDEAQTLVRKAWAGSPSNAEIQQAMLERFGGWLGPQDHERRLDALLYDGDGPAAQAMLALVPSDYAAVARARIAYRAGAANAGSLLAQVSAARSRDPGLAFDRARYLRSHGQATAAAGLIQDFPSAPPGAAAVKQVWQERWAQFGSAMRAGDWSAAYRALDNHGLPPGGDLADAEFSAGWIALRKMRDPVRADGHFERLQRAGSSPITLGRAFYWRGRAREAMGDLDGARAFYEQGARFSTAFYGQLSAQKAGVDRIRLGADPEPSAADRARFEGRELVQAARLLAGAGERDLFRTFVLAIDDTLPNAEESALLVDLARGYGDQDLAMRVVRTAAQRGFILPERGYPLRDAPAMGAAEPALVLGIVRQESGFDPKVQSGVGARGMMQLMPGTARIVAGQIGLDYAPEMLDEPDYNMRLGSFYISELVDRFSGSYVLAAAGYNAGPGRPAAWIGDCTDPRSSGADPTDFIECIPFSETRNYVMRVLEGTQVYRARMNGGEARLTLADDLKRGG